MNPIFKDNNQLLSYIKKWRPIRISTRKRFHIKSRRDLITCFRTQCKLFLLAIPEKSTYARSPVIATILSGMPRHIALSFVLKVKKTEDQAAGHSLEKIQVTALALIDYRKQVHRGSTPVNKVHLWGQLFLLKRPYHVNADPFILEDQVPDAKYECPFICHHNQISLKGYTPLRDIFKGFLNLSIKGPDTNGTEAKGFDSDHYLL